MIEDGEETAVRQELSPLAVSTASRLTKLVTSPTDGSYMTSVASMAEERPPEKTSGVAMLPPRQRSFRTTT